MDQTCSYQLINLIQSNDQRDYFPFLGGKQVVEDFGLNSIWL